MRIIIAIALVLIFFNWSLSLADVNQLDLIFVVKGKTNNENLGGGVCSPGDLTGDGFSEVFVDGADSVKVFNGGNPADTIPIKTYLGAISKGWINDLNGDGYKEYVIGNRIIVGSIFNILIYYGSPLFYSKESPDLIFSGAYWDGFGMDVYSSNTNIDSQNELVISEQNSKFPFDGKFYIYEHELDTIPDDTLIIMQADDERFTIGACIGDYNSDGYADFAISPSQNEHPSYILIYNGSDILDTIPEYKIWSPFPDAPGVGAFGAGIIPLEDINIDGYNDFLVTSGGFPPCVFYGGNPFDTIPKILQYPGKIANTCGDINHDGWEDNR